MIEKERKPNNILLYIGILIITLVALFALNSLKDQGNKCNEYWQGYIQESCRCGNIYQEYDYGIKLEVGMDESQNTDKDT